jgi:hypothetical protein
MARGVAQRRLHVGVTDVAEMSHRRGRSDGPMKIASTARDRGDLGTARERRHRLDLHHHASSSAALLK